MLHTGRVPTRPPVVTFVAGALAVVAAGALLVGLALTWLSTMSGPADPLPAALGVAVAAACLVAAGGAWRGRLSRGSVLLLAAGVPLVCLLASGSSVEMAALAPIALVGWIVLALLLRGRTATAWLGG